jgi:hypothetical protein
MISAVTVLLLGMAASIRDATMACERKATQPLAVDQAAVAPGTYQLVLVATKGNRKRARASGLLTLRQSPADERPRPTGELPVGWEWDPKELIGRLDIDLTQVAAPMCGDAPDPRSNDPVYPGVLVKTIDWGDRYPKKTPVMVVGTLANRRDGTQAFDGCGIGLFVTHADSSGIFGKWDRWGIVRNGSGYFCAYRASITQ